VTRLAVSGRSYGLATVLGLALASGRSSTLQATILLAAVALVAGLATWFTSGPVHWILLSEAVMTGLIIGTVVPNAQPLLPYLVVPALLAGLQLGLAGAGLSTGFELLGIILIGFVARTPEDWTIEVGNLVPWLLTAIAVGGLGTWFKAQQDSGAAVAVDQSYEAARRLLAQLRSVARRLSSGLDTVSLASQLMITATRAIETTQAAVFVRTEGGLLAPLGYSPPIAQESLSPVNPVVDDCIRSGEPVCGAQPTGSADRRSLCALPLRTPSAVIGVLVLEGPTQPAQRAIQGLQAEVDAQSLRLDAALIFDEVRSLATLEERQRVAREIHDGVAQEVASLGYRVDELLASATSDRQRAELRTLRGEISRVVTELRHSIFDLRAEVSSGTGLGSALSTYARTMGTREGITVHLTLDEAPIRLRPEVETELFRIAQEAITNARKHSRGRNLWVNCRIRPPAAEIIVRDDGRGLSQAREDSYGVRIMRERAGRIGALLSIDSGPRTRPGTTVRVTLGTIEESAVTASEGGIAG
jgi:signal transduction histidine kinase